MEKYQTHSKMRSSLDYFQRNSEIIDKRDLEPSIAKLLKVNMMPTMSMECSKYVALDLPQTFRILTDFSSEVQVMPQRVQLWSQNLSIISLQ